MKDLLERYNEKLPASMIQETKHIEPPKILVLPDYDKLHEQLAESDLDTRNPAKNPRSHGLIRGQPGIGGLKGNLFLSGDTDNYPGRSICLMYYPRATLA